MFPMGMVFGYGCVERGMRTGWVKPNVAVVVKVAITFGSVTGSNIWGFCDGNCVMVSVDLGIGVAVAVAGDRFCWLHWCRCSG